MMQILAMIMAAALFLAAVAADAGAATLRAETVIRGNHVTLGDLFDGLPPEQAATTVAQAPALGREVTLDAGWIGRVARTYRVAWNAAGPHERIVLRRASHRLGTAAFLDAVSATLAARFDDGRVEIQLDNRSTELHLPIDVMPTLAVEDLSFDPQTGRFVGALVAPAEGPVEARLPISGRARAVIEVPVLVRRLRGDDVIAAEDIAWQEITADRSTADVAMTAEELIGMSPRRVVAANRPVPLHDLRPPVVVARGARVIMLFNQAPLQISTTGRALEDGAKGQVIRVVNIDSNRTIEAMVADANLVTVMTGAF